MVADGCKFKGGGPCSLDTCLLVLGNRKLVGLKDTPISTNICSWHYLDVVLEHGGT